MAAPLRGAGLTSWRRFEAAALAAGTGLLIWLLARVGLDELTRDLSTVGWGFLLVLALQTIPVVLNAQSWRFLLPPDRRIRLRDLTPMLLAGEGINAVSPVGVVGGELVRVSLLRRRVPTDVAAGSVVLAATTQFVAQVLFILCGLPFAVVLLRQPDLRVALLCLGAAIVSVLAAILVLAWSPRRFASLRTALGRLDWFERLWARVPQAARDGVMQSLGALRTRPGDFALSVAASFGAWQAGVVETLLVLFLLGQPISASHALAIEVLAITIEAILFFVPARMGTQEGGRVLIFVALGLNPATGLALGLVRRFRELVWAIPGLVVLGKLQPSAGPVAAGSPAARATRGGRPLPD